MTKRLAILGYHRVGPASAGQWETWYNVSADVFAGQLIRIRELGWQFVDAAAAAKGLADPQSLPDKSALVTFDDGFRSVFTVALPKMIELQIPGVMFVPTQFVGRTNAWDANTHEPQEPICTWDELRQLDRAGVSVQSHSVSHRAVSKLDPRELDAELRDSKSAIEKEIGKPVEWFSFPYGDGHPDQDLIKAALHRNGYRGACLYTGSTIALPADEPFRLARVAMGNETDPDRELTI